MFFLVFTVSVCLDSFVESVVFGRIDEEMYDGDELFSIVLRELLIIFYIFPIAPAIDDFFYFLDWP